MSVLWLKDTEILPGDKVLSWKSWENTDGTTPTCKTVIAKNNGKELISDKGGTFHYVGTIKGLLLQVERHNFLAAQVKGLETFDGLTAAECLVRYQKGMQEERVRVHEGKKYIVGIATSRFDNKGGGLNHTQFVVAQKEFTRIVREKASEAKRIKEENEMVRVDRDTDYFGE